MSDLKVKLTDSCCLFQGSSTFSRRNVNYATLESGDVDDDEDDDDEPGDDEPETGPGKFSRKEHFRTSRASNFH